MGRTRYGDHGDPLPDAVCLDHDVRKWPGGTAFVDGQRPFGKLSGCGAFLQSAPPTNISPTRDLLTRRLKPRAGFSYWQAGSSHRQASFPCRKRLWFAGRQAFLSFPLQFQQPDVFFLKGLLVLPVLAPEMDVRQRKCQYHDYADLARHVAAAAKPTKNSNHAAGYSRPGHTSPERIISRRRRNRICLPPGLGANAGNIQSDNSRYRLHFSNF